jgi:hypothetical protein
VPQEQRHESVDEHVVVAMTPHGVHYTHVDS